MGLPASGQVLESVVATIVFSTASDVIAPRAASCNCEASDVGSHGKGRT